MATSVLLLMGTIHSAGQVTNYALRIGQNALVDCGRPQLMEGKESYTLQLWICPDNWTKDAVIICAGDGSVSVRLSDANTVEFKIGDGILMATSADLQSGRWSQLTLLCDGGEARVLVNGIETVAGRLPAFPHLVSNMLIGGGAYQGRIDELRLWSTCLPADFDYFIHTTVNRWNPEWDNLVAYYKFDQDLCDNIVDYKSLYVNETYNLHGIISGNAMREAVCDNPRLPYLVNGAYTANERFYDRAIPREQYLLANDLIILGIQSYPDGHLKYVTPCNHGIVSNGGYMAGYQGRKGVLALHGDGAKMSVGMDALALHEDQNLKATGGYTFETWIYLEKWTEGAYIFRKCSDDGSRGFSISLGADSTKQIIVSVDGNKWYSIKKMHVGEWMHFAVRVHAGGTPMTTFDFMYNGKDTWANTKLSTKSIDYKPTGTSQYEAVVGENLDAKLDETCIYNNINRSSGEIAGQDMLGNFPMPGIGVAQTAGLMMNANSLWLYDKADNVGYDFYSQDEWKNIMEKAYQGYRGYQIRISVKSHNNWQKTISSADRRRIFAADLARLSAGYDGVELDLEWPNGSGDWHNYGLLVEAIRTALPAGKKFMVSPHAYNYGFPADKMDLVDGFTFQQYGPQNKWFFFNQYKSDVRDFKRYGYTPSKICTSYSTTTSGPYSDGRKIGYVIIGVRNGLLDAPEFIPQEDVDVGMYNSYSYYFTGPRQTYMRAKYATDNGLMGIFYWDMGNDVPVAHRYNLAKWCSYGLNSNVDTLITEVTVRHPVTEGISTVASGSSKVKINRNGEALTIEMDNGMPMKEVFVYNALGQQVFSKTGGVFRSVRTTGNLPTGIYFVKVTAGDGSTARCKIAWTHD